jgi:hypothetical protein
MPIRKIKAGHFNTTSSFKNSKTELEVQAESNLEADFLFKLDQDDMVEWYDAQPIVISYQLPEENFTRTYTPDVLVRFKPEKGEKVTLYEVKFRSELIKSWRKLKPKFKAAIAVCKEKGWKFKIVTEREIRTPELKNREFLFHFSRTTSPVELPMRSAIFKALSSLDFSTPSELLAILFHSTLKRAEALPVLWRMIYENSIEIDMNLPLNMNSQIKLRKGYQYEE